MVKKLSLILVLVSFVLANGIAFAASSNDAKSKQPQAQQAPPVVVKLMSAQQKTWEETIQETGSLSAFDGIMLSSEVNGRITHIYFKSGQEVKKAEPLIEIFPDIVKAELEKAQAQLKKSKLDYQRNYKLSKKGFVDKSTLDSYIATRDSDQANVNNYKAQLEQHEITAPFSGNIGLRLVSLGDYVSSGQNLVSLQSLDPIRVDFSVPQKYIGDINIGDKVSITSQAFSTTYTGKIYAKDSIVDANTRMMNIRATIDNPKHILVPGTFVEVTLSITHPQPVIVIPQTAVVYSVGGDYVYVMRDNKAAKTQITLGNTIADNMLIVLKGLKVGDQVIVEGQMKLFDGSPVITEQEYQQYAAKKMQSANKK